MTLTESQIAFNREMSAAVRDEMVTQGVSEREMASALEIDVRTVKRVLSPETPAPRWPTSRFFAVVDVLDPTSDRRLVERLISRADAAADPLRPWKQVAR